MPRNLNAYSESLCLFSIIDFSPRIMATLMLIVFTSSIYALDTREDFRLTHFFLLSYFWGFESSPSFSDIICPQVPTQ